LLENKLFIFSHYFIKQTTDNYHTIVNAVPYSIF